MLGSLNKKTTTLEFLKMPSQYKSSISFEINKIVFYTHHTEKIISINIKYITTPLKKAMKKIFMLIFFQDN